MKLVRLASPRSASRRNLLAILALTLAVLTAALSGIVGYAGVASAEALRSLAASPGGGGYFRVAVPAADDAHRSAAESVFAELGLDRGLQISSAEFSPPLPLVPSGGSATNLPADLTFLPVGWTPTTTPAAGSLDRFTAASGSGAELSEPLPAALAAAKAESLGLEVGDTFAVEGADSTVRLELVATLDSPGPDAAFLDPVPLEGSEPVEGTESSAGASAVPTAVVVPPAAIARFGGEPGIQWVFTVGDAASDQLAEHATALENLPERLSDEAAFDGADVTSSGGLASVLASAAEAVQATRAVLPIPLTVLSVVGALTVVQLARLLASDLTSTFRQVVAPRTRRRASFIALAVLIVSTVVSLWQFLQHGTDNPFAETAPSLLLLAGTVLALLVMALLARASDRGAVRLTGLALPLAVRQVSRRFGSFVIPAAVVALTMASATFSAVYMQTSDRSQEAASQIGNGSDVRVTVPDSQVLDTAGDVPNLNPYAELDSVTAASLAHRGEVQLGSQTATLVAVDAAALPGLLPAGGNLINVDALSTALAYEPPVPEPALALTPSASQVRLQFSTAAISDAEDTSRRASITAWIRDEEGAVVPVPAGTLALSGAESQAHSLSFALPDGLRAGSVTAVDIALDAGKVSSGYEVELTGVASDGGIGTGQGRFAEEPTLQLAGNAFGDASAGVEPLEEGVGVRFPEKGSTEGTVRARLMVGADAGPLPVAFTSDLAAELGLAVGDPVSLASGEAEIGGTVAAVSPLLPGASDNGAVIADLQAYSAAALAASPAPPRAGEVWLASTDSDASAAAAAAVAGVGATFASADSSLLPRFITPTTTALWIGVVGALLVGATALTATVVMFVRSRRSEVAVLRMMGTQVWDLVRGRGWELLGVGGAGVVLGLLAGLGVATVTVPLLVQSVLDSSDALGVPLSVALVPLLLVLLGQLLVLAVAACLYGKRVQRQALRVGLGDVNPAGLERELV
ncbi:FtsX-like permease family protein [Arthrobacter sp. JZ12]|uniref:FtsX-like permease family protein n=1 Tax=Arthrobacter sp. JZ12 TaxID=2654190 RepID=UPI002B47572B|nr:FtsX-like permease family protein [Arthrobacter sp. JZ12]WRH25565.1 FtsX-like permease family protein [Arthrobacter sp. JZ12]